MTRRSRVITAAFKQQLLYAGALDEKVDLGSWMSIERFMLAAGVPIADVSRLSEDDLDAVRRRLQRRGMFERFETVLERVSDSGFVTVLLLALIAVAMLYVWDCLKGQAHAATHAPMGPTISTVAGVGLTMAPLVIAVLLASAAMRGRPSGEAEHPWGDTTGYGEHER